MGLKWSSVDLDEGIIVIERALLYTPSLGIYEGPTKTGKIRAVRISNATLELLRKHKEAQQRLKEKNGDRWIETGYVFAVDNGDHMTPDSITQWLAKFSETHNLSHIHPHAFRHNHGHDLRPQHRRRTGQSRPGAIWRVDLIKPKEARPEQVD